MLEVAVQGPDARGVAEMVVTGEWDIAGLATVAPQLDALTGSADLRLLRIDLRELEFLDATGLTALIDADARTRAIGRRIVLVRAHGGPVARLLEITSVHRHLEWVLDPADIGRPRSAAGPRYLRGDPPPP